MTTWAGVGTNFSIPISAALVDFSNWQASVLLPDEGTYLMTVTAHVIGDGTASETEFVTLYLWNASNNSNVTGAQSSIAGYRPNTVKEHVLSCLVTTDGPNKTVELRAVAQTASRYSVVAQQTTLVWVRVA